MAKFNKHIILIGFPGSGKTSLGHALSTIVDMPFIDTDDYITAKTGKSIPHLFSEYGEKSFRETEHAVIKDILLNENPSVIATGGGMPCFHNNIDLMNQHGITVYLISSPETLYGRLKHDTKRPMFNGKTGKELEKFIKDTLSEREPIYEKSQIVINVEGTPQTLANDLVKRISEVI